MNALQCCRLFVNSKTRAHLRRNCLRIMVFILKCKEELEFEEQRKVGGSNDGTEVGTGGGWLLQLCWQRVKWAQWGRLIWPECGVCVCICVSFFLVHNPFIYLNFLQMSGLITLCEFLSNAQSRLTQRASNWTGRYNMTSRQRNFIH